MTNFGGIKEILPSALMCIVWSGKKNLGKTLKVKPLAGDLSFA